MNQIQSAWKLAEEVHNNQKRYNNTPYIFHVREVVEILKRMGIANKDMIIAAILHDVVEDGGPDYLELITEKFSDKVRSLVCCLTHTKELSYEVYITIVRTSKEATIIKLADMIQNVTENPTVRQREKYEKAFPLLVKSILR